MVPSKHLLFVFTIALLFSAVCLRAQGVISGVVTEKGSGEYIIGANVIVAGTARGTAANRYGHYSISGLPLSTVVLYASAVGYKSDTIVVALTSDAPGRRVNIPLAPTAVEFGEVLVEAERAGDRYRLSVTDMPVSRVLRLPSLGGEPDVLRAIQLMPGVNSSVEAGGGLYVRGGNPDQNLVLVDGAPVYSPFHVGGLVSVFNADAVNSARMYKGAMPAEYGGRLSSVADVSLREGSRDAFHGSGGISLINARLTLEGPLGDDATFLVSARRMYLDPIVTLVSDNTLGYLYYDGVAKASLSLGENDRLFLSGFVSTDELRTLQEDEEESNGVSWGNVVGNLRWHHIFGSDLTGQAGLTLSRFRLRSEKGFFNVTYNGASYSYGMMNLSELFEYRAYIKMEYRAGNNHAVQTGAEYNLRRLDFRHEDDWITWGRLLMFLPYSSEASDMAIYVQHEWDITDRLSSHVGLRGSWFSSGDFANGEPRAELRFAPYEGTSLKAGVGFTYQYIHLLAMDETEVPGYVWYFSSEQFPPAFGRQAALGIEQRLWDGVSLGVEGYYKEMEGLLAFRQNVKFMDWEPIEKEMISGTGQSYGMEILLKKEQGTLSGWLGYTLSWSNRTFPDLNRGITFPAHYDSRHDITVVLNYRPNERWDFGLTWMYVSGSAVTSPLGISYIGDYEGITAPEFVMSSVNGFRLPDYHRLDVSASYMFYWLGWKWKSTFNLCNAYNRFNPGYHKVEYNEYIRSVSVKRVAYLPILPSIGFGFEF